MKPLNPMIFPLSYCTKSTGWAPTLTRKWHELENSYGSKRIVTIWGIPSSWWLDASQNGWKKNMEHPSGNGGFEFGGTPIFRFLGHLYILLTCSWENNHQSALFYGFVFMVSKGPGFVTHNPLEWWWVFFRGINEAFHRWGYPFESSIF